MTFQNLIPASTLALLGATFLMLPSQGFAADTSAAQSTAKACSVQYQAAKTAGTLNGQKWPQFLSGCSAAMKTTPAAAPMTPPKATKKQTTAMAPMNTPAQPMAPMNNQMQPMASKKQPALAPAVSGHQTTQQICGTQYQAAKSAGTLGSQKWPQFLSACSASIKADNEDAAATPPEPAQAATPSANTNNWTMPAMSASGKPLTSGEVAFRQRIHECSTEWQSQKSAGTLPAGAKWPQFWSSCNTRLKAEG